MEGQHWSSSFEHESLSAPEARESFNSAMSKYDSQDAAVIGGFNAGKLAGKPYKLPGSIDKLPEDIRGEFTANARKVLGIEDGITSIDDLVDMNFAEGMQEGQPINEEFATAFKEFAVENKFTKASIQKLIGFNNNAASLYQQKQNEAKLEATKATNEALVQHFGGEDKVAEQSEMVKRYFRSKASSPEAFEKSGLGLVESGLLSNPELAIPLIEAIAPLAKEASTENGNGGTPPAKPTLESSTIAETPATAEALGWK